jgi:hypothetical protein
MSSRYLPAQTDGEHGRATQLLEVAVSRQSRLRAAHEAAQDTPYDMSLDAALRVADDEVAARERWLRSVDAQAY